MSTFHERKAERSDFYRRFVHGWRMRPCSACAGSGYYDNDGNPSCGACDGTGRESFAGPKSLKPERAYLTPTHQEAA